MEGRTDYNGCKACGEWKLARSKMVAKRAQSAQVTPTATICVDPDCHARVATG
jgi:hypothetical protein